MDLPKAYMVQFSYEGYDIPSADVPAWINGHQFHKYTNILNISTSDDLKTIWITMEADSESRLIKIIDSITLFSDYEFQYYSLKFTSSIINFSKFKLDRNI